MEKNEEFSKELETQYNILIKAEARKTNQRFIAIFIVLCLSLICGLLSLVFSAKAFFNSKEDIEKNNAI
jgi:maltodextrin utilization protein YvdJ